MSGVAGLEPLPDWQTELKAAVTDTRDLIAALGLPEGRTEDDFDPSFPVRVPRPYLQRIEPGNPADPLLRQVLATQAENLAVAGYQDDPLGEAAATRAPGLIVKYAGRALLIAAPACAVHCRYCFRRAFPYEAHRLGPAPEALDALRADTTLTEVILSGGDPLMLKDEPLGRLLEQLDDVAQLRRLRIHTRLPIVIPARVTERLVSMLGASRLRPVLVVHANHGNEIDATVGAALAPLAAAGVQLLNQSVLLRGVNDDAGTLAELSERLFAVGVLPYYLHLPDPVTGTQHFSVAEAKGLSLLRDLQARLPGYLVPRLAREVAGAAAKQWPGESGRISVQSLQ